MENKYVLIIVLKLLRFFIDFTENGIFIYMKRHKLFEGLRQLYYDIKKYHPHGVVKSLFLGLLKGMAKTENSTGLTYFYDVMCL